MAISKFARGGKASRRSEARKNRLPHDPRVPINGERVRLALGAAGLSENHAARLLVEKQLASISQPALNNIATGKTRTCRRSVRDGLATLCGEPITSEWLGGTGELEQGIWGAEWEKKGQPLLAPWDIRAFTLLVSLMRAWERDRPEQEFPRDRLTRLIRALLDPRNLLLDLYLHAYLRIRDSIKLKEWTSNPFAAPTYAQRDTFSKAVFDAAMLVLQPCLENPGCADWDRLLQYEAKYSREAESVYETVASAMPDQSIAEARKGLAAYYQTMTNEVVRARKRQSRRPPKVQMPAHTPKEIDR